MNNDQAKSIDVVFSRGIRQDLDPHTAPPGSLTQCQNLEFDQLGRLIKRDGFAIVGTTTRVAKSPSLSKQVRRVAQAPDGTRLLFSDTDIFAYMPAQDGITQAGSDDQTQSVRVAMTGVSAVSADNSGTILFSDSLTLGAWIVHVYLVRDAASAYQVYSDVIDSVSGARVLSKRPLNAVSAANYPPRLVVSGGSNIVFALWEKTGGTTIQYAKLDLGTTPIAWGAATDLVTTTGPAVFDADTMTSGWVLVYYSTVSTRPVLNTYDSTPSITNTVGWAASGGASWTPSVLAISGNSFSGSIVHVAGYNTGAFKLECASYSSALVLSNQSSVDPGLDHAKHAKQMAIVHISNLQTVISFSNYTSPTLTTNPRGHVYTRSFIDSGSISTIGNTLVNYSLASRLFCHNNGATTTDRWVYLFVRFDDPSGFQNHIALICFNNNAGSLASPTPQLHFASGRIQLAADNAVTGIGGIADLGSGKFLFGTVVNIGASQTSGNQLQCWTFQSLSTQRFLSTPCQSEAVIAGGTPLAFDGQRWAELSFYSYPVMQSGNITPSAVGGSIAQGIYQYRAVYEWTDANGNRHQSPAAPAITVDMSSVTYVAGTNSVAFSIPTLSMTRKSVIGGANTPIRVVLYRTLVGGVIFYRVPTSGWNVIFSATPTALTDTYADASISGNEPIYVSQGGQGLLASTAPPPTLFLTTHAGRLWGVDCENPERIWCTRVLQQGSAPAYNPALQVLIPGAGRINGIGGQDGKLYALATNGIYLASYGDGPDDTGAGAFPSPELITTAANCTDPRGVLVGTTGIFFTGKDQWGTGIYLIRRGDGQPLSIGRRVRDLLATYPVCRGVADRVAKARTEFLFVTSDTNPTASIILYYHHDYLDEDGIGQWTSTGGFAFVGIEALGAWDDQSVIATNAANATAWQTVGTALDLGISYPPALIETADIRPAGLLGFAQVAAVSLLGTQLSADPIQIEFSYNSGFSWVDAFQWSATTESVGQPVIRRREPATQKQFDGSTIRVRITDPALGGSNPGKTYFHGVAIELVGLGGNARLDTARRS